MASRYSPRSDISLLRTDMSGCLFASSDQPGTKERIEEAIFPVVNKHETVGDKARYRFNPE